MKNWINMIPPGDPQSYPGPNVQTNAPVDSQACISFSACHVLESQMRLYGDSMQLSERFLAKISGTTEQGNSVENVLNAINTYGLVSVQDWPELTVFTWDEFNATISPEVIARGKLWLARYSVRFIADTLNLKLSPSWTILKELNENHAVERLNQTQYFDSYQNPDGTYVKTFSEPILYNNVLQLIPKNMSNVLLVKKGNEYGYYVPATNEPAMIDKALNFAYPLPTANGGTTVDWPNVVPDITLPT